MNTDTTMRILVSFGKSELCIYTGNIYPSAFVFHLSLLFEITLIMEQCSFPWQLGSQEVASVDHTLDKKNFSRAKILNSLWIPGPFYQFRASLES